MKFESEQIKVNESIASINAEGIHYRDLNSILRSLSSEGVKKIELSNVCGQRYIGTNLNEAVTVEIHGTPGNDLGAFMKGPTLIVCGNAQDGCGNTMDDGKIIIHGHAGDILGYSMRGGSIFIRDDVGYRVGIHMKEYQEKKPVIVVGGTAQDFLGEYMAGGTLVILGLNMKNISHNARFVGTGMHGGKMYVRGKIEHPSKDVEVINLDYTDMKILNSLVDEFCNNFEFNINEIMNCDFSKIVPISKRPYEKMYAV